MIKAFSVKLYKVWNGLNLFSTTLLLFVIFTAFSKVHGTINYAGDFAADGPSYLNFDLRSLDGFFGGIRTFPYPLLISTLNDWIPLQILIPFLNLFFLAASTAHLTRSFHLLQMNFASFFFVFLVLISPVLNYVPFMGTDLIGMSLWTLSFSLASRISFLGVNNKLALSQTSLCIFFAYLVRPALLAPAIFLFIYVFYLLIRKNKHRSALFFLFSFVFFNLLYFLPKYIVTDSPTIVDMTGGLLVGHTSLLGEIAVKQEDPRVAKASNWVKEAEQYLTPDCRPKYLKELQDSRKYNAYIQTHNKCYTDALIRIWTRAIYDETKKLPLPSEYSLNKQMNAEKYTWPYSSDLSLSTYHLNYSVKIDRTLLAYDLEVLSKNKLRYMKLLLLESAYGLKQIFQVELWIPRFGLDVPRLNLGFFLVFAILLQLIFRKSLRPSSLVQSYGIHKAQLLLFLPALMLGTVITNVPHQRFFDIWIPVVTSSLLVLSSRSIKGKVKVS